MTRAHRIGTALLLATTAVAGAQVRAEGRTVTVDNVEHHNRTVLLDVGDTLVVRLPRNAGTGYHWQVDRNDPALLKLLGEETKNDAPARPGVAQTQEFRFEAVAAGGEELELTLLPPGEPRGEIGDWARYVVVIRDHDQPHTMTITERANRDRLTLRRGDELVIRLPAQAGTAYRWKLLQPVAECLQAQGEPGEPTRAQRPGGPVWQVFRYKAAESGTARLRFAYDRVADERGDAPSKRFEVTLVIPAP